MHIFLLLTLTKKLLLVTSSDPTAETGVSFWTHGTDGTDWTEWEDGKTDVKVEIGSYLDD